MPNHGDEELPAVDSERGAAQPHPGGNPLETDDAIQGARPALHDEWDAVIADVQRVILTIPKYLDSRVTLTGAQSARGRVSDANTEWPDSHALQPGDASASRDLMSSLVRTGRLREAIAEYEKAISRFPRDGWLHAVGAYALHTSGRYSEAVMAYQIAIPLSAAPAERVFSRVGLGRSLVAMGRLDEALQEFEALVRSEPESVYYRIHRALTRIRLGRLEEGMEDLRWALEREPDNWHASANLALALRRCGRSDEGEIYLRRAVEPSSYDPLVCAPLAELLLDRGALQEAVALLQDAVARHPESPVLHRELGFIGLKAGRLQDAGAAFQTAIRLEPKSAEAEFGLGLVFYHRAFSGKARERRALWEQAVEHLQSCLALTPGFRNAALRLAQALWGLATEERTAEAWYRARNALLSASRDHPQVSEVFRGLAEAELALGNRPAALVAARKMLSIFESAPSPDLPRGFLKVLIRSGARRDAWRAVRVAWREFRRSEAG